MTPQSEDEFSQDGMSPDETHASPPEVEGFDGEIPTVESPPEDEVVPFGDDVTAPSGSTTAIQVDIKVKEATTSEESPQIDTSPPDSTKNADFEAAGASEDTKTAIKEASTDRDSDKAAEETEATADDSAKAQDEEEETKDEGKKGPLNESAPENNEEGKTGKTTTTTI